MTLVAAPGQRERGSILTVRDRYGRLCYRAVLWFEGHVYSKRRIDRSRGAKRELEAVLDRWRDRVAAGRAPYEIRHRSEGPRPKLRRRPDRHLYTPIRGGNERCVRCDAIRPRGERYAERRVGCVAGRSREARS